MVIPPHHLVVADERKPKVTRLPLNPYFPFSRLREKVPDRADEGVGSVYASSSREQKCFNTCHACENPWFLLPVGLDALVWGGLCLRDDKVSALIPLRR